MGQYFDYPLSLSFPLNALPSTLFSPRSFNALSFLSSNAIGSKEDPLHTIILFIIIIRKLNPSVLRHLFPLSHLIQKQVWLEHRFKKNVGTQIEKKCGWNTDSKEVWLEHNGETKVIESSTSTLNV